MTNCKTARIEFLPSKNKKIEVEFVDKDITSDGGILLLREVDKINNFTHRISSCIPEYRDPNRVIHSIDTMVKQRIYGLALGYEDVNDQDKLRKDKAMIIATDQSHELASSPTICRLENAVNRRAAVLIHKVMIDVFIKAHKKPPKQITLDADPTDLTIHGEQEGKHYHAYYGSNCFLPLNIFCGEHLLVNYLRPSNIDGSKHCWVILALLVKYIRKHWPNVNIIFRGDCAFSRDKILTWCEKNNVRYIVGQSSNEVLKRKSKGLLSRAANDYEKTGVKQKLFDQDFYAAKSWSKQRKVVMKTEYGIKGDNVRFVVTNLRGLPEDIYRQCYCPRGDMENRIKELKLDCYANRMSGAVLICAHPSDSGIQRKTGTGGSTAWNNTVRSRWYFSKPSNQENSNTRILSRKKANYGPMQAEINLEWQNGVFVPTGGFSNDYLKNALMKAIEDSAIEDLPFSHTGEPGVYKQRARLPVEFHTLSRQKLEDMVTELLEEGKLIKTCGADSKEPKRLSVAPSFSKK